MRTPDSWQTARATLIIAAITVGAFMIVSATQMGRVAGYGAFVASDWWTGEFFPFSLITPLSATLLHAGFLHIGFNMLMLAICGRSVEGAVGPANLVILYIAGAYAAAAGQFAMDPQSNAPMIGASGAVSAVIGAYAMLFGKNRVRVANARAALWLNVLWLLAAWVAIQFLMGFAFGQGGVLLAVGAHIGGFVAGLVLARPLLLYRYRNA